MFADRLPFYKGAFGLLALILVLAAIGCGDEGPQPAPGGDSPAAGTGTSTGSSEDEPDVADADPADVEVISAWAETLAAGDVEGAAEFFALPSVAENGPLVTAIETREDAIAFNQSLPCGATVVAAQTTGSFTTATFALAERPGGDCGPGVGGSAETSFTIENGKISEWRRVGTGDQGPAPGQSTS